MCGRNSEESRKKALFEFKFTGAGAIGDEEMDNDLLTKSVDSVRAGGGVRSSGMVGQESTCTDSSTLKAEVDLVDTD